MPPSVAYLQVKEGEALDQHRADVIPVNDRNHGTELPWRPISQSFYPYVKITIVQA